MPTAIEWTDETFNPWWGCEKVSPGCAHCYAEGVSNHRAGHGLWGAGHGFRFFGDKHWAEPLRWNRRAEREGRRIRVFCASMADVFEERPELEEHRLRLFELIAATPALDWQLLTKRPEFARDWLHRLLWDHERKPYLEPDDHWAALDSSTSPLPNVWMGVSIENARHTWRADVLREIPAAVRFISAEPLLGSLYKDSSGERAVSQPDPRGLARPGDGGGPDGQAPGMGARTRAPLNLTGIDWVIVGGESGRGARPMHPDWAREIRDACLSHEEYVELPNGDEERWYRRPAFFFKQWGEWAPSAHGRDGKIVTPTGRVWDPNLWHDLSDEEHRCWFMTRLGKKAAGRELDGRTWDEMPAR
jgi:protein gp37